MRAAGAARDGGGVQLFEVGRAVMDSVRPGESLMVGLLVSGVIR